MLGPMPETNVSQPSGCPTANEGEHPGSRQTTIQSAVENTHVSPSHEHPEAQMGAGNFDRPPNQSAADNSLMASQSPLTENDPPGKKQFPGIRQPSVAILPPRETTDITDLPIDPATHVSPAGRNTASSSPSVRREASLFPLKDASSRSHFRTQFEDTERDAAPAQSLPRHGHFTENCKVRIIDVPFSASDPALILSIRDPWLNEIPNSFKSLKEHPGGAARIFEYTTDGNRPFSGYDIITQDNLLQHIETAYGTLPVGLISILRIRGLDDDDHGEPLSPATDVDALCSQFTQNFDSPNLKLLWTPTAIQYGRGKSSGPLELKISYLCCLATGDGRLVVVIVNRNQGPFTPSNDIYFPNEGLVDILLGGRPTWTSNNRSGLQQCALFLVMNFLLTCIYLRDATYFDKLLRPNVQLFKDDPLFHIILSLPHRYDPVPKGADSAIIDKLQDYEYIFRGVQDVTGAVLFLLEALGQGTNRLEGLKVRELCSQRVLNCERTIERIHRMVDIENKLLSIRESASVKRLTILAALFLPASLASSILSMSIRFKDLGPLLYDWLGVFVLVSSAAIILYFSVRAILHLKANVSRGLWSPKVIWGTGNKTGWTKFTLRCLAAVHLSVYLAFWGVILACFCVGMFHNFILGGKVFGYGIAGIILYILFLIVLVLPCLALLDRTRKRRASQSLPPLGQPAHLGRVLSTQEPQPDSG